MTSLLSVKKYTDKLKEKLHSDFYQFIMAMVAFSLIIALYIYFKKRKRGKFLKLFENKIFLILLGTIGIFSFATLNKQGNDEETTCVEKEQPKNGLLGFLIALINFCFLLFL